MYLTALDRNGERERIADASADAAYVPPQGTAPGYVLMVQGDSLVAQPFDADAMRVTDYPVYPSDWSLDGKFLLYMQDSPGHGFDVWALSLENAGHGTPILQSTAAEKHGGFSPNSQFIAFTSDESGRDEVYIQKFSDPTTKRRVSTNGGGYPRWSRKGNDLFFGRSMANWWRCPSGSTGPPRSSEIRGS